MKLLLILGLLAALVFIVLQAGPAEKTVEQAAAAAATPAPAEIAGVPNTTPQAKTHYRRSLDKAQQTARSVEARNGSGEF